MLLVLLAAIAFGIMMFTSDRDTIADDDASARVDTLYDTEVDTLGRRLAIAEYTFDPSAGEISGSVMNGTERHFVNVQVEFTYFDLDGDSAGVVRDTTRELQAGETWTFNLPVETEGGVSRVVPGEVSGAERETAGRQTTAPR